MDDDQENLDLFEQEEDEPKPKGWLEQKPEQKHLTLSLGVYCLCILTSLFSWNLGARPSFWVSKNSIFLLGEYWRLLTALFVHADVAHLLSNMPLFVIFGWYLRAYFGFLMFPIVPFIAGMLTNLSTINWYPPDVRLLGISGVVYAIVGIWLVLYLRYEIRFSFGLKIVRVLGFSLLLLFPTTFEPRTSYLAHSFGLMWGILLAVMSLPFLKIPKYSEI